MSAAGGGVVLDLTTLSVISQDSLGQGTQAYSVDHGPRLNRESDGEFKERNT